MTGASASRMGAAGWQGFAHCVGANARGCLHNIAGWTENPHRCPDQGQYLEPAAVFSSNGDTLYIITAGQSLMVTIDFQKQAVISHKIQPQTSLLDRLMVGTTVANAKTLNGIIKSSVLAQMDGCCM
jgi:hypothetical protein